MKNILLPTDFSKNSMKAIHYAMELLKDENCQFYILNVQKASSFISDDMMVVNTSATVYKTLITAAKKSIDNIIKTVKREFKNENHDFHSIVDYDNFIDSINQVSINRNIDLIIMGTKGASGLEKVLFGSNTVRAIQRCIVPVLAIPEGCKFQALDTIAFTSSFSSSYQAKDFKTLQYLVSLYNSKLHVVHAVEDQDLEEKLGENMDFFQENFPDVVFDRIELEKKDVYDGVHDFLVKNKVKMIGMCSKRYSFLRRLFTRHAVETFAFKIDIPFLVIHKHN